MRRDTAVPTDQALRWRYLLEDRLGQEHLYEFAARLRERGSSFELD